MSLSNVLFSFTGRVPRSTFWYFYLASCGIGLVLGVLIGLVAGAVMSSASSYDDLNMILLGAYCIIGLVALLFMYPTMAVYVKRAHDLNHSGWFVLVMFIPIIGGIWLLIELGFLEGTIGPNQYGPDPIKRTFAPAGYQI
jgi:uncharacterized membrane protein YhaH (DUF805 family)